MIYKPQTRKDGLTLQNVGEELVVYDSTQQRALRLNATAAEIFNQCNGTKTAKEIAAVLTGELESTVKEESVLLAIDDFAKANLLIIPPTSNDAELSMTRRSLIKKAAVVAFALPMVESIFAPTPAMAASGALYGNGGGSKGGGITFFSYRF